MAVSLVERCASSSSRGRRHAVAAPVVAEPIRRRFAFAPPLTSTSAYRLPISEASSLLKPLSRGGNDSLLGDGGFP